MGNKLNLDAQFEQYYKEGLSDYKIAKLLNCAKRTVKLWRDRNGLQPNNLSSKDKYNSWSKEEFYKYYNEGLTDNKIAIKLGVSESVINSFRLKNNLKSNQSHNIIITKDMEEIIVGTLLGDGYINSKSKSVNKVEKDTGLLIFAHTASQKDYCFHKYNLLKDLFNREPFLVSQIRKGKENTSYYAHSKSSISLKKYRDIFYKEGIKIIPSNIEDYFTPQSLAYLYMDDGTLGKNSPTIALCSFDNESLQNLQNLLLKWGIETSIHSNNNLYIKANSRQTFFNLINPYIITSMRYKLSL